MPLLILFIAYQLTQFIFLPFIVVYLVYRKMRGKPVFGVFAQRMGWVPSAPRDKKVVWLHAVSVGEVLAIQALVDRMKKQDANAFVYLTTGTQAGNKVAREQIAADMVSYLPFDFFPMMVLAFVRIKPARLMIVEADLWPNLLFVAWMKKVPCYLLNARLTQSSALRNWLSKMWVGSLLRIFKHIYAQTKQEQAAFETLGVMPARVSELGNIKAFNVLCKKQELLQGRLWFETALQASSPRTASTRLHAQVYEHRPVRAEEPVGRLEGSGLQRGPTLLVGSLHQPELIHYLDLFKVLKPKFPGLKLMLAPRHFHWQQQLVEAVKALHVPYLLVDNPAIQVSAQTLQAYDVVMVCTIGKLFELYQLADLFFLGGTFVPVGGHNLLEPAVWGKLTIVGPHYHNSTVIADELEAAGGLIKVKQSERLVEVVSDLLGDQQALARAGQQAERWLVYAAARVEQKVDELVWMG